MKSNSIFIGLITLAVLAGCGKKSESEQGGEDKNWTGSLSKMELGRCDTTSNAGAALTIELWKPADSSNAGKAINAILTEKSIARINEHADSASTPASGRASVQGAFDNFEKNYNKFHKDFPDAPGCWQIHLRGDTVMTTPKVVFYQYDHYAFTGGAHPNSFRSYYAFDAKSGAEVNMESFIADTTGLLKIVEAEFRKLEKLDANADLEKSGYFLLDHKFFLPNNFVFKPEGVYFYYNPYEISTYARGAIDFTIPYAELGETVKRSEVF